ncbi:MAG: polyamine aminopropyltransferase [Deltaproteobacteria bacterium]|nr:polyamine aminopropyltransferase [Deltaproteobacteria bacterium]
MAQDWYRENHTPHAQIALSVRQRLFDQTSEFQRVEVVETDEYGKMLLLDGCVMCTERDEFIYHEMIIHPALCSHPNPRDVLIIGGGDGGSVREAIRHRGVKSVTLVEIDALVIEASRRFLPSIACGLDDPRVDIRVADGFVHLDDHQGAYDVIVVDSTDPVGPGEVLFTEDFFKKVKRAARPGGIVVFQSENPMYYSEVITKMHRTLRGLFSHTGLYLAPIPTYPGGLWSFTMASDEVNPLTGKIFEGRMDPAPLKYYNPKLHRGAFLLPNYVKALVTP